MKKNPDIGQSVPEFFYTFTSPKSNKTYHVHIEEHPNHFYAVKFHLKDHKKDKNKYNILVNYFETRPVIYTCIAIMLEIAEKDKKSSFGFIGSNTMLVRNKDKHGVEFYSHSEEPLTDKGTKRFRIYSMIMTTFFSIDSFRHMILENKNAYALLRASEMEKDNHLPEKINTYFSDNYEYFT